MAEAPGSRGHQDSTVLPGEAQAAYRALGVTVAKEYGTLTVTILDCLGLSEEEYCWQFRQEPFTSVVAQWLRDFCSHWLKSETHSSMEIVEPVTLEQFFWILLAGPKEWVCFHQVTLLEEAVRPHGELSCCTIRLRANRRT